jgi:UDP-N-acetyl-D-glucosamine dehydrogenase
MTVGIVGLGYVGLPLVVAFAETGRDVVALDVDDRKVRSLKAGTSYIEDIPDERLQAVLDKIEPTTRPADLAHTDAILICVPTPLTPNREPDLTALLSSGGAIAGILQAGQLIVLESTTYPGTTREQLLPVLERSGLKAGHDFNLAYSPERIDPGRTDYTLKNTPKIVGGLTQQCGDRAEAFYGEVCDNVVRVKSPEVAEMSKLLENIFRSVNIALVNELAILADRMDLDIWEVIEAAATKPYGFMRFEPGPGMGGHCLPVDPFYLTWRAREFDMATEFIELAGKTNTTMPYHCVQRIERALNESGTAVNGAKIALIGVSYKPGVGDMREAPALKIAALLHDLGADLHFHDPFVETMHELTNEPLEAVLDGCNAAVIITPHPNVDHGQVIDGAPLVVDLRGVTRGQDIPNVRRL